VFSQPLLTKETQHKGDKIRTRIYREKTNNREERKIIVANPWGEIRRYAILQVAHDVDSTKYFNSN
jgi:hypothetical protein